LGVWDSDEVMAGSGFGLGLLGFCDRFMTSVFYNPLSFSRSPKFL
jgi:hypothetical protein